MTSEAAARAADVLARERCQTALPVADLDLVPVGFGWLDPILAKLIVAGLVLVALLAVSAAVFALYSYLRSRRTVAPPAAAPASEPEAPPEPAPERAGPTLIDADRRAAAGDFREALHLLLLVAIKVCAGRAAAVIPRSATSRELRATLPLGDSLREGFAVLVDAVERSLFAERPVGAEEYAACRARCAELLGGHVA